MLHIFSLTLHTPEKDSQCPGRLVNVQQEISSERFREHDEVLDSRLMSQATTVDEGTYIDH